MIATRLQEGLEFAQNMRGDDDGFAEPLKLLQNRHHLDAGAGVEAAGGFRRAAQELRIVNEDAGEAEALLHPAAQGADQGAFLFGEADEFKDVVYGFFALGGGNLVTRTEEIQVLRHFHVFIHAEEIRHVTDDVTHRVRVRDDIVTEHFRSAGGGSEKGCENAQRGGLARAVGTDEAEQVAAIHGEIERTERGHRPVGARQADGMHGGQRRCGINWVHKSNHGAAGALMGTDMRQRVSF